jgi:hypothetical protein
MKFSCILISKEGRTCNVCRQWSCNGHREHLEIQSNYGGNSPNKRILEKHKRKRKGDTPLISLMDSNVSPNCKKARN